MLLKADDNFYYSSPACKISVAEIFIQAVGKRYLYEVRATYVSTTIPLKTFRDKDKAKAFAKRLVDLLNEVEK